MSISRPYAHPLQSWCGLFLLVLTFVVVFFFDWLVDFGLGCFGGWWVFLICCYFFPPGKLKCSFITNLKKCNLSLDFGNHTRNVQYKNISILQRIVQAIGWTEKDIYLILAKVQSTINPVPT